MRSRPSARLLVFNDKDEVFLFQFIYKKGPLAGQSYWSTPGGAVEAGETFEQAGIRELEEETGLKCDQLGPQVAQREFVLELADGELVNADERYFVVRPSIVPLSFAGWTALETEVMAAHRWWSWQQIADTDETIWPENLLEMLFTKQVREGSNAHKALSIAHAYLASRDAQEYSDGNARVDANGKWQCWFERLRRPMMDPIHVVVLVDADTGECEVQPLL